MDNNFKTIDKQEVTMYGTACLYVYESGTEKTICKVSEEELITFKRINNITYACTDNKTYQTTKDFIVCCPNGVIGICDLKRRGKQALYRGEFKIHATKPDKFYLINTIELEEYLKGVVSNEMPYYFGLEALKAQAVAARNYAIKPRTKVSKSYDVVDSVASQVYFGYNTETKEGNKAVEETEGILAFYNTEPILALYSSCAGGYTENYSYTFSDPDSKQFPSPLKPYLLAKPDNKDTVALNREENAFNFYTTTPETYDNESKYFRWTREWTRTELEDALKTNLPKQSKTGFVRPEYYDNTNFGTLKDLRVVRRGNSGKIIYLDIVTTNGKYRIEKELVIRRLFTKNGSAIPSANVVFVIDTDLDNQITNIKAYGGGYGHGVGMSQHGANYMAKELKKSFDEILKHYYTGIFLGTKPVSLENIDVVQCFYAPSDRATIEILDRKNLKTLNVEINNKLHSFDLSKYMNIQKCSIPISDYIKKNHKNTIIFIKPNEEKPQKRELFIKFY